MVDRRYNALNKYGNGRLYGASDAPITADRFQWGVDVAWTGTYSGTNESVYMTDFYSFRGRHAYLNPNGRGFAPVETGRARITLDNSNGRYDGWNTASPLYPNVEPGKDIRIRVRDLESGTIYSIFTGIVVDIETIGYGEDARVVLVCEDGWYHLRNTILLYTNSNTDGGGVESNVLISKIVKLILDTIGWTAGYTLETSTDTIPYWWSSNNSSAGEMLNDVSSSHFGYFFVAANGQGKYYSRTSVRASVASYTQSQILKDIVNAQPYVNRRNSIRIKVHSRASAANQVVWTLSEPIFVASGDTVNIQAVLTYNGFTVPVTGGSANATTDYTMNTLEDGTGTNLTSYFTVIGTTNIDGETEYGDTVALYFLNSGTADGWITFFRWTGTPKYEVGTLDIAYPPLLPAKNVELFIDSIWHQKIAKAKILANLIGAQLSTIRQFPIITFDTRPESLVPDLFDYVDLSIAALGISDEFQVSGIEVQTTNETCQGFRVRQYLEPHFTP